MDDVQSAGKAKSSMTTQLLGDAAEGTSGASESEVADVTGIAYGGASPQVHLHELARLTTSVEQLALIQLVSSESSSTSLRAFFQTVSSILTFVLAMCHYPEVQAKAQAELLAIVGTDRLPEFSDRPNLPYINAIVLEVLRWQPVANFGSTLK